MTRFTAQLGRRIIAGLCDAGLSSIATFLAGAFAVRYLDPHELGSYSVFFNAFLFAQIVPAQLLLVPAEIGAVSLAASERLGVVRPNMAKAAVVSGLSASIVLALTAAGSIALGTRHVLPLAVTAGWTAVVSPLQDFARRMLHQARLSWTASVLSSIHVATTAVFLLGVLVTGVHPVWGPLGALATANTVSLCVAMVLIQRTSGRAPAGQVRPTELTHAGRWLAGAGASQFGASLAVTFIVAGIAGSDAVGYAEAARVLSGPIVVLAMGLGAVLQPRLMETAQRHAAADLRYTLRLYVGSVLTGTALYVAVLGVPWGWNPLPTWFASAYEIRGLLPLLIVSVAGQVCLLAPQTILVATGREAAMARATMSSSAVQVGVSASGALLASYAVPIASLAAVFARVIGFSTATAETPGRGRAIVLAGRREDYDVSRGRIDP